MSMINRRSSGILLHPTSLPGRWGIGDLGAAAYQFVDFLQAAGQQLWQVMPLGPTGYGDSPYQSFSAFAGNPMLISIDLLLAEGLLAEADLVDAPQLPSHAVDFGAVIPFKQAVLRRSFERFSAETTPELRQQFNDFLAQNHTWLNDYALFAALKEAHGGAGWNSWPTEIARHEPDAVAQWSRELSAQVQFHSYVQFLFRRQWHSLKQYANERGISIIGDIPIFVAYDSADLWANPDLFWLDQDGNPTVVAGVPPDYFSATGQRWGNPLYRWNVLAQRGYTWWIERFRVTFSLVDIVRIDHFRGFAAYWEVPASEETAINGRWVAGPSRDLFDAVRAALGDVPIIAEDLGLITPDVIELRDGLALPGMKVLQFAFGGSSDDPYLPHNYLPRCVVYTGTHDNDTTRGWWQTLPEHERMRVQMYLGRDGSDISWDLIRLALMSVADTAIIPLQDVLDLGSEARMNTPGLPAGNWSWRFQPEALNHHLVERLRTLTALYARTPPATN
ncbi:MAG: 4-alpha-glucanotransferase [Roseiflexaceae bacterium]